MAQIKSGLVSVTAGSQIVSGSNTTWLSDGVEAGHSFIIQGEGIFYDVASVDSETQITLSGNYAGSTKTDVAYVIATDFTPNKGYPEMESGSLETAALFTRAMREIDEDIGQLPLASDLGTASSRDVGTGSSQVPLNSNLGDAAYKDVMSSLTDTTAGRLMPVGAGGLLTGRSPTGENIEAIKTSRFFYQGNSATNKFGGGGNGTVLSAVGLDDAGGYGWQFGKLNNGPWKGRRLNAGVWSDDETFYTSENILGTVSQSGGVPTGAIIETGSNANGDWVTLAGGFTVCSRDIGAIELADTSGTRDYLLPIDSLREPHSAYMSMRRGNNSDIWYAFNQTILMVSTNNWRLGLTDGSISSVTSYPITLVATGYRNDL